MPDINSLWIDLSYLQLAFVRQNYGCYYVYYYSNADYYFDFCFDYYSEYYDRDFEYYDSNFDRQD